MGYADAAPTESPRVDHAARAGGERSGLRAAEIITHWTYLPMIARSSACAPISGEVYNTVAIISAPTNPPAEIHPDLNLAMRGYVSTTGTLGLVDYGGPSDPNAPQLYTLFGDNRTPSFSAVYQVYDWDWSNNRRGALISDWPVTLAGMVVTPTEIIRVPTSGGDIGLRPSGYEVMVLYATPNRITLKYTREDDVVLGYTIHIENICVEPNLLALYNSMNAAGRARLPALFAGQGIGRAITPEIGVAIRDAGSFMDPRSRKDWWQGR
ncbi:MAG: hypothetical protein FJ009_01330 [Chloroflexi bacterium]|nr:hypothetical protein [Chloroflexota bacterium]